MRIKPQLLLRHRGQAIMPTAEIDGLRRHHDPNPGARPDHNASRSAAAICASRAAAISPGKRTVTPPISIMMVAASGGSNTADPPAESSSSIITGANAGVSNAGNVSFPAFA